MSETTQSLSTTISSYSLPRIADSLVLQYHLFYFPSLKTLRNWKCQFLKMKIISNFQIK